MKIKKLIVMLLIFSFFTTNFFTGATSASTGINIDEKIVELRDRFMESLPSIEASDDEEGNIASTEDSEYVRVIVELENEPVIKSLEKTNRFFSEASKLELSAEYDSITKVHTEIKRKISSMGISIRYRHTFKTVYNGFSAEIKRGEIDKLQSLRGVRNVYIVKKYELDMESAKSLTNVENVWNGLWNGQENGLSGQYKGEGMLVAVIDSGIDPTHRDLVLSPGIEKKIENEAALINLLNNLPENSEFKGMNLKWFTEKVPTGYNWADKNNIIWETSNLGSNHGMHVAGIIAANGDESNGGIKGAAPEAQLISEKVVTNNPLSPSIYSDDVVAAINHAVAIGADVINMSLGAAASFNLAETNPEYTAMKNAADSGVIICKSAGNSSNYSNTETETGKDKPLAKNPDVGVSDPTYEETLISASINNTQSTNIAFGFTNGTVSGVASYLPSDTPDIKEFIGTKNDFDVVFAGFGRTQDFDVLKQQGVDVAGKIVLIKRGSAPGDSSDVKYYYTKVGNAQDRGAAAVVVLNDSKSGNSLAKMGYSTFQPMIPAVLAGYDDALDIMDCGGLNFGLDTEPGQIGLLLNVRFSFGEQFKSTENELNGKMADTSTWGATNDLKFYPDVTSPGGSIWSLKNGNSYQNMGGTSMASPHTAGVSTLVYQAFKKQYPEIPKNKLIENVKKAIMNTASPVIDPRNNKPYLTRKQGAGIVQADRAVKTPVVATRKIELKDFKENTKLFTVEVENISNETASYILRSNPVYTDETVVASNLKYTTTRAAVIAGAYVKAVKVDETVIDEGFTLELESKEKKIITFEVGGLPDLGELTADNPGEFVEGFAKLEAASDKYPSLSIPFMGFYGDWNLPRIIDRHFSLNDSFHKASGMYTITPGNTLLKLGYTYDRAEYYEDKVAKSNHSVYSIQAGPVLTFLRNAEDFEVSIYEAIKTAAGFEKGKFIRLLSKDAFIGKNLSRGQTIKYKSYGTWMWDGTYYNQSKGVNEFAPDGYYMFECKSTLEYENSQPQYDRYVLRVESVVPEIRNVQAVKLANGDVEVSWEANDNEGGVGISGYNIVLNDDFDDPLEVRPKDLKNGKYIIKADKFKTVGDCRINVIAFDMAGNGAYVPEEEQPVVQIDSIVQKEPLLLSPEIKDINYTAERSYDISYTISPAVNSVRIIVTAETGAVLADVNNGKNLSYKIGELKRGYNTVKVSALNKVGTELPKGSFEFKIMVDQELPTIAVNLPRAGATYFEKKIRFAGAILDSSPMSEFKIGGVDIPLDENRRFDAYIEVEKDGEHEIPIYAKDIVGHVSEFLVPITVDTTAPVLSIDEDSDPLVSSVVPLEKDTYVIKGGIYDELSRVGLYINTNNIDKITIEDQASGSVKPFEYVVPLEVGKNAFTIELVDMAGNQYIKQFIIIRGEGTLPELTVSNVKFSEGTVSKANPLMLGAVVNENINWTVKIVDKNNETVAQKEFLDRLNITYAWVPNQSIRDGRYKVIIEGISEDGRALLPIEHDFTVLNSDIRVERVGDDAYFKLGSDAKVTVIVTNNSEAAKDATLIIALYDKSGKMINYVSTFQMVDGNKSVEMSGVIKIPSEGSYKVKCFVWDNFENMNPLSDVFEIPVK